jgi:hypothetical protein
VRIAQRLCETKRNLIGEGTVLKLTAQMLSQSRVIAKGNRIRDLPRLIASYGGNPSKWTKRSGPLFEIGGMLFEYHWYEHPDVGRVEVKRKQVNEK